MKMGEFNHPRIRWSMYDNSPMEELSQKLEREGREEPTREEFKEAFDAQHLELEAGAPPGIHDFTIDDGRRVGETHHGIVINEDGRFDPHLTAHAIHIAQRTRLCSQTYDYVYVEALQWDPEKQLFLVSMGS